MADFANSDFGNYLNDTFAGWAMGATPAQSIAMGAANANAKAGTRASTNATVKWLTGRGMDPQQAAFMASNPTALADYLKTVYAAQDPKSQLELKKLGIEVNNLQNPPEPDSVRALKDRAAAAGLQPGTPEYNQFMTSGGVKTPQTVAAPKEGYQYNYDNNGNVTSMSPIPGGPADTSKQDAEKQNSANITSDVITDAATRAVDAVNNATLPTTGRIGNMIAAEFPSTNAAEVRRQIDVLKSNARIETLNAMRAASKTGASGMGNLTEGEGEALAQKAGALDPASPNIQRDIQDYYHTLLRTVDPVGGEARYQAWLNRGQGGNQGGGNARKTSSGVTWSMQ
jgi:hypothetical protein